jgi:hypothetical protein
MSFLKIVGIYLLLFIVFDLVVGDVLDTWVRLVVVGVTGYFLINSIEKK